MSSRWSGRGGALAETHGTQVQTPAQTLVNDLRPISVDAALQISTVWACIDRRATMIASLPFFTYEVKNGEKKLARGTRLYQILHDSPNSRMTPFEFWRAMVMFHDLRGRAYARIERDDDGEVLALWPMPSDQVESRLLPDGSMVYLYRIGNDVAVLSEDNVYHLKNLGNGTEGLAKLDFMQATTDEAAKAQDAASKLFAGGGKQTGILMVDRVLKPEQRAAVKANFLEMTEGTTARLHLLEADMKYQPSSLTPEQMQLLESRTHSIEELCRWYDVPPVLVHHSNVTAWGTGVDAMIKGFYTTSLRPLVINIEQGIRKRVMTPRQRATMTVEFSLDALLRGDPEARSRMNATNVQNALKSRAEVRQLEGDPYIAGTEVLTVQSNLLPLNMLGKVKPTSGGDGAAIAQ